MRTDASNQQSESVETMKVRKSLHPLQEAAGDKENLVGAGRMPPSGKDANKTPLKKVASASPLTKVEKKNSKTDKKITVNDLTSQAGPSEHYWQILAERRRVALDEALAENVRLHEQVAALKEENENYEKLMRESKSLIDTLTEILNGNESDQSVHNTSITSDVTEDDYENARDE